MINNTIFGLSNHNNVMKIVTTTLLKMVYTAIMSGRNYAKADTGSTLKVSFGDNIYAITYRRDLAAEPYEVAVTDSNTGRVDYVSLPSTTEVDNLVADFKLLPNVGV
jgi:hypothetical protein